MADLSVDDVREIVREVGSGLNVELESLRAEVKRLHGIEARALRWLSPDRAAYGATMYGRGCLDTAREILGDGAA